MFSFRPESRIVVTGASSGIGLAVAKELYGLGAHVIAVARCAERLREEANALPEPSRFSIETKDLAADTASLPVFVSSLGEKHGPLSGLVHCAGRFEYTPIQSLDAAQAKDLFEIDYFAPVMLAKGFLDRRNNAGRGSSLVFISSIDAALASKGQSIYAGAKAALCATIKSMAREAAPRGIRMNCLLPSRIDTPMAAASGAAKPPDDGSDAQYPFGWGRPADVASFAAFLLSEKAAFISGQSYIVDSGGVL